MSYSPSFVSLSALLIGAPLLFGQSPTWQPPANGFLYDSVTRSIRSIIGIPGSSYAGPTVEKDVDWACLAPNGHSGLILRGGQVLLFQDFADTSRNAITLEFGEKPSGCLWSADSTRAILLLPQASSLIWISGLDVAPTTDIRRDLSSLDATGWSLLAADMKADAIVLSAKNGSDSTIYTASSTSIPISLGTVQRPVAAAFANRSGAIYLADADAHIIYGIQPQANPALQPLFTADDGIGEPAGLLVTNQDQQLVISDAAAQSIRIFDLNSHASVLNLELYDAPGPIVPLAPSRFLVNRRERSDQPFRFLDTSGAFKIVFIPVGESL